MQNGLKIFQIIKNRLFGHFPQISYSRSGEDLIINEILNNKMGGFYVDVGAYHFKDYSNTYKFYLNGWNGINIDANQEIITKFDKKRPKDVNICAGVAFEEEDKVFYRLNEDLSMSSFSTAFTENAILNHQYTLKDKTTIKTRKLGEILESCNITKKIDFMSIDVEGLDLDVLKSNNWNKYRPKIIIIELESGLKNIEKSKVYKYLINLGYEPAAYTFLNKQIGNLIVVDLNQN